jgi:hypothetical protein
MRTLYVRREVTTDPDAHKAFTEEKLQQRRMKDVVAYADPAHTLEVHRWPWNGQKPSSAACAGRDWWINGEEVHLEWEIILTAAQKGGRASHRRAMERKRLARLRKTE